MKIFVTVKRVPDTGVPLRVKSDRTGIDREGLPYVINPYDEYATEAALRIKEKIGDGEVIAVSCGTEDSIETIRHALAMGADRGVLLKVNDEITDSVQTADILSDYLKSENPDFILMGKKAVDYDRGLVPAYLSEKLGFPLETCVTNMEIKDSGFVLERETEYGVEIIEARSPLIISFEKAKFEPRFPSLRGVMMAKKKPVDVNEISNLPANSTNILSYEPPPERKKGKIIDLPFPDNVKELVKLLKEESKII
jgi:electron transfer flavoprotein beta subunit